MKCLLRVDWPAAGSGRNGQKSRNGPTGGVHIDGGPEWTETQVDGGLGQIATHRSIKGFQPPPFARRKIGWGPGSPESGEGLGDLVELPFKLSGPLRQRRGGVGFHDCDRVFQETPALGRCFRQPPGLNESQSLRVREMMVVGRGQDGILVGGRQAGQLVGQGGANVTAGESLLRGLGKVGHKSPAFHHPFLLASQQLGNGSDRQLVIIEQGADNAAFVERGQRPPGSVGQEQKALVLGR
jgi:hypothetical protein